MPIEIAKEWAVVDGDVIIETAEERAGLTETDKGDVVALPKHTGGFF